eukprot:GABV01012765.1.p1 GENE.GABV01012765.1~~GABV01012765.1.p1  ORF type:complete len:112 (-),score=39.33 GABV01012765.1:3-338(-)
MNEKKRLRKPRIDRETVPPLVAPMMFPEAVPRVDAVVVKGILEGEEEKSFVDVDLQKPTVKPEASSPPPVACPWPSLDSLPSNPDEISVMEEEKAPYLLKVCEDPNTTLDA